MPKLVAFLPCEQVIIATGENNPTVISILTEIKGEYESAKPPTIQTMVPYRWAVFTMWQREDGDDSKEFAQKVVLRAPGGDEVISKSGTFSMVGRSHRFVLRLSGVPIGEQGEWIWELYIANTDSEFTDPAIASYGLLIDFKPKHPG